MPVITPRAARGALEVLAAMPGSGGLIDNLGTLTLTGGRQGVLDRFLPAVAPRLVELGDVHAQVSTTTASIVMTMVLLFVSNRITLVVVTTITCKIPEKLDSEMEAVVQKQGISKSEFVRQSIERNLEQEKSSSRLSAYDVMKEACGIIRRGPRDLATNPKHMKAFGRD